MLLKISDPTKIIIWLFLLIFLFVNIFLVQNPYLDSSRYEKFMNESKIQISPKILPFYNDTKDLTTLLDVKDFKFLINHPEKCPKSDIFMIIVVHSSLNNSKKRDIIRKSWGNQSFLTNYGIKLVFGIGITNDTKLMRKITEESNAHHDLIQGNFIDNYRNLSYKHIMGLKWITYFCKNVSYVLKTDDDVFVNIPMLVRFLKMSFGNTPKNLMACYLNKHSRVSRSYRNKWRLTHSEYEQRYFPRYCAGWSVLMSQEVAHNLYLISKNRPMFWIDDVFVTGILANDLNVYHFDISAIFGPNQIGIVGWLEDESTQPPMLSLIPEEYFRNEQIFLQFSNKTCEYYHNITSTLIL